MTPLSGILDLREDSGGIRRTPAPVTFSGRLHHRGALADMLGVEADQETDESLVRRAYDRWGTAAIERLRGRFAIAIWDAPQRTLVLARDPIGLVPLYYHVSRDALVFSSAVTWLAAQEGVPRELDEATMAAWVLRRQANPSSTFLKAVNRLRPGHLLTCVDGCVTVRRHYQPRAAALAAGASDEDYADALRHQIESALREELPHGERVGIHLSGGLDSSGIACLALRQLRASTGSLVAASSGLPQGHVGIERDEEHYLRALQEAEPGLHIERVTAGDASVFADLEDGFARLWSPVNAFHYMDRALAGALRRQGARVVLSGFGGDAGPSLRRAERGSVSRRLLSPRAWLGRLRRVVSPVASAASPQLVRLFRTPQTMSRPNDNAAYHLSRLETGIGAASEELIGFHASLGLDLVLPYFNLELLEFLAGVPARQFKLETDRSLFRRSMIGVLPELIRTRADKHPYVPDFPRRLGHERASLLEWLEAGIDDSLDAGRIERALRRVRPVARFEEWDGRNIGTASTGIIAARFLKWFATVKRVADE